jgi:hypothetical protein
MKIGILSAGNTLPVVITRAPDTTTSSPAKLGDGMIAVDCPPGHRTGVTGWVGATPTQMRRSSRGRQA